MRILFVLVELICLQTRAQNNVSKVNDSISAKLYDRGVRNVNKCKPWHHLQCVYITGTEVYKDGVKGESTRHWWRMSYIGKACTDQHGTVFGKIFEGVFAIPHYIGVGIGNGAGFIVYLVRGSPEKIEERKRIRKEKRALRKIKRNKAKSVSI